MTIGFYTTEGKKVGLEGDKQAKWTEISRCGYIQNPTYWNFFSHRYTMRTKFTRFQFIIFFKVELFNGTQADIFANNQKTFIRKLQTKGSRQKLLHTRAREGRYFTISLQPLRILSGAHTNHSFYILWQRLVAQPGMDVENTHAITGQRGHKLVTSSNQHRDAEDRL